MNTFCGNYIGVFNVGFKVRRDDVYNAEGIDEETGMYVSPNTMGWLEDEVRLTSPPPVFGPYNCQDTTVFPCILYRRLQVRLDGHFCAVYASQACAEVPV